jgi:hypothetical protein
MLALALAAAALAATPTQPEAPFFPPNPRDHIIIDRIYYHRIPDPGADHLRLCVKDGQVCAFYNEKKASGLTITIPLGKRK